MDESQFLGSEEVHREKIYVFLIFLLAYGLLFFGLIGATGKTKDILIFYILFTTILGLLPITVDMLITRKEAPLDTVVHEGKSGIRSLKMQLIISLVISVAYGFFIFQTQSALIKAPQLNIFEGQFGNALLSATVGSLETLPFFLVLFPTAYAILSKRFGFLALFMAGIIAIVAFTIFHFWVYKYDVIALQSVALFALINIALLYIFRSAIPLMMIHFVNNWIVVYFSMQLFFLVV